MSQRSRVIDLYKTLLHLGREWPAGAEVFRSRLHAAFLRNASVSPDKTEDLLKHGQYVAKEIEALYSLKKYRTLRRRYYTSQENQ